jgi:dihydropyrimidinase
MDVIIRNGSIVNAAGMMKADVGIKDEKIVQIGGAFDRAAREIDATDCYVMPGGIDVHTHIDAGRNNVFSTDDFGSGTIAAACGGTTTIIDMCSQDRGQTLGAAISRWDKNASGKAAIDYGYHMIVADLNEGTLKELRALPEKGITSFKVFMAYRDTVMIDDTALLKVFEVAKEQRALVLIHAENGNAADYLRDKYAAEGKTAPIYHALSRPPRVEAEATARAVALAEIVGASLYVVHLTCGEALDELIRGKRRGVDVLAETCTQYLYTTKDDLDRPHFEGAKFVFTPPARTKADHELLWDALADRVLETVSSDHCSWSFGKHKILGKDDFRKIPNGAPGVEERLMMVYQGVNEGRISLPQFVDLVATRPAQIFGLYPKKGAIAVGADADILIWDPKRTMTITQPSLHSRMDYTTYEGHTVKGVPKTVLLRGKVIVDGRNYVGTPGEGRFLKRDRYQAYGRLGHRNREREAGSDHSNKARA